jgi:uncharacterized protein (DUF924 family)
MIKPQRAQRTQRKRRERCIIPMSTDLISVIEYAIQYLEIIQRFGRFPHRNQILGRETTPEEAEFLKQRGSGF